SSAEALAGAVTVNPATGESTVVTFSNGLNSVNVTVTGDGTAQNVALTAADLTTLGDGTITVDAVTTDTAGNSFTPAQTSFTLDTVAPTSSIVNVVAGADFATAAEAEAGAIEFIALSGETVTISFTDGVNPAISKTFTATGQLQTVTLTAAEVASLADGTISVDASISDLAGNVSTSSTTFILDAAVATPPILTAVAGADIATADEALAGVITISPVTGETTAVVFTGTAGNVTVSVVGDGTAQAVQLSTADLTTLGEGAITVDATSTDTAGNVSAAATQVSFVLDTLTPATATVTIAPANLNATAAEATAGAVEVSVPAGETSTVTFTGAAGTVTFNNVTGAAQILALTAADLITLGDGSISVEASISDAAGNIATTTAAFILDTTVPNAPTLTLAAGADLATALEAESALSISPLSGETTTVTFSNGANLIFKTVSGTGTAQTVALTTAEVATLGAGTVYVNAQTTDAAGNVSTTAQTNFVLDNIAPTIASVTPVDNATAVAVTDNIVITLSENVQAGAGNFVIDNGAGDVRNIDVNDATQVTILNNTVTINPIGDLIGTSNYNVTYAAGVLSDLSGNALAAQTDPTLQNFTTAVDPTVDSTVVIFDLVNGVSSDHSGRVFDANTTYTIYVVVDPANSALNAAPAAGSDNTFGAWTNAGNLGADDNIIFTTSTGNITGVLGGTATVAQPAAVTNTLANASYAWTGTTINAVAAGITELGLFTRNTPLGAASNDLWSGSWLALGDGADLGGLVQAMPAGLLTSQGLV
ncbi:MAG: Ig-like domain-containing protein, partial [Gammaproteobacteria bacterium]|nr:Ig-like domain-containing protein [Gammaproteobacteria bacterium]